MAIVLSRLAEAPTSLQACSQPLSTGAQSASTRTASPNPPLAHPWSHHSAHKPHAPSLDSRSAPLDSLHSSQSTCCRHTPADVFGIRFAPACGMPQPQLLGTHATSIRVSKHSPRAQRPLDKARCKLRPSFRFSAPVACRSPPRPLIRPHTRWYHGHTSCPSH